jgi:phosphatidylserine decarboxylase
LPKNLLSRLAGRLAALRWPRFLRRRVVTGFGRVFGVDFSEVREPLESFASIQEFFIRYLKDGARPIDRAPDAVVSPCDGAWGRCGVVRHGLALQVKGRPYRVGELLGQGDVTAFEGGEYATFYLSPKDYHRFHTPFAAAVAEACYLPGDLWPVNRVGVEGVHRLFSRNERIVAFFRLPADAAGKVRRVAIAAVGATMVGKVHVTFDDLTTNVRRHRSSVHRDYHPPHEFEKGQEWGRFEFGSTLVLVAERGALQLDVQPVGTPLRLGRAIGRLLGPL